MEVICGLEIDPNGVVYKPFKKRVDFGPIKQNQVDAAKSWIQENCIPLKTPNKRAGSYGLKHRAEEAAGIYVANGAFIKAALELGYKATYTYGDGPNCIFNMYRKDKQRIDISDEERARREEYYKRRSVRKGAP